MVVVLGFARREEEGARGKIRGGQGREKRDSHATTPAILTPQFAGNTDIPKEYDFSNQVLCDNPTDKDCRANTTYPMGSGRVAPYGVSWGGGVCKRDPTHSQLLDENYTIVTKISSQTCHEMWSNADWSKGGDAGARDLWCKPVFKGEEDVAVAVEAEAEAEAEQSASRHTKGARAKPKTDRPSNINSRPHRQFERQLWWQ